MFGQTTFLEGRVLHASSRAGLENVVWQTRDSKGRILRYGFSKTGGVYRIPLSPSVTVVEFRLIGFATQSYSIKEFTDLPRHEVILSITDVEIPEVRIALPPIVRRADTIRYNAESFRTGEDRYVVDLIKKLPGLTIGNKGSIYYQGEPISRFYIEGRDLLGGQYGIASQNMSVDAVASVEVLENHQHIKALQDVARPAKAALNIRLKDKFKFRPFGEVEAGAGFPWLYKGKVFLGLFNKALQIITHAKGNNTGEYILEEMDDKLQLSEIFFYSLPMVNKLGSIQPKNLEIDQERYFFHHTYLGSLNTLVGLSEASELKLNLAHGTDWMRQNYRSSEELRIRESQWDLSESTELRKRMQQSKLSLHYEHNGDKIFVQNDLILRQNGDNMSASIIHRDVIADRSIANLYDIQNRLNGLYKTPNKNIFQFKSLLRWQGNREQLKTQEALSSYKLDETLRIEEIFNRNQLSSKFHFPMQTLGVTLESEYEREWIELGVVSSRPAPLPEFEPRDQQALATRYQFSFIPNYSISFFTQKIVLSFSAPVAYSYYKVVQKAAQRKELRPIYTPTAGLYLRFNYQWDLNLSASRDWNYSDKESLLQAPYFSSYRNIFIPSGEFHTSESYRANAYLQYKNLSELFFWNLRASYLHSCYNYLPTTTLSTEHTYLGSKSGLRTLDDITVVSDFTKNFLQPNLSFTFSPTYNAIQSPLVRQGIRFVNRAHLVTLALKSEWHWASKLTVAYQLTSRGAWTQNRFATSKIRWSFDQKVALSYFPIDGLELTCKMAHTAYEHQENSYHQFYFLDALASYKYKKFEFTLLANNLLNLKRYSIVTYFDISTYRLELPLRGREFLAMVKFSF